MVKPRGPPVDSLETPAGQVSAERRILQITGLNAAFTVIE